MSQELNKALSISEVITKLTRKGEPFPVTKALPYLNTERQQRILHQWELVLMNETLDMKENEMDELVDNMQKPAMWCLWQYSNNHGDMLIATFASAHHASRALYNWMCENYLSVWYDEETKKLRVGSLLRMTSIYHADYPSVELCEQVVSEKWRIQWETGKDYYQFEPLKFTTNLNNTLSHVIPKPSGAVNFSNESQNLIVTEEPGQGEFFRLVQPWKP